MNMMVGDFLQQARVAANRQKVTAVWNEAESFAFETYTIIYQLIQHESQKTRFLLWGRRKQTTKFPLTWNDFLTSISLAASYPETQLVLTAYLNDKLQTVRRNPTESYQVAWRHAITMLLTLGNYLLTPPNDEITPLRHSIAELQTHLQTIQHQADDRFAQQVQAQVQHLEQIKVLDNDLVQQRDYFATAFRNKILLEMVRQQLLDTDDALLRQFQFFARNAQGEPIGGTQLHDVIQDIDARLAYLLANAVGLIRIPDPSGMSFDGATMDIEGVLLTPDKTQNDQIAQIVAWGYFLRTSVEGETDMYRKTRVKLYRFQPSS